MSATANLRTVEIGISGSNMRSELPLLQPTIGPPMVDVRSLHEYTGCFAYGPALGETATCRSAITYVDGDNGILLYRGCPIADLVENGGYLDVCWLLLNGELPTAAQLERFTHDITHHTMVNEQLHAIYRGFRRDSHPMAVMCGVVGALAAFYHDGLDIFDPRHRMIASHRLIAKMPTIAAMAYKYLLGQPFVYPRNDLGYAENFLNMLFSVPCEPYRPPTAAVRALDALLIIQGRPRTECLDLDDAVGRIDPGEPLCLHRRSYRRALGTTAWRRQRGRAADPGRNRLGRAHPRDLAPRQGQERPVPAGGVRPPDLQELRPAGEGAARLLLRAARHPWSARRPAPQDRDGIGAHRARRRVFRRAKALSQRRFLFWHHLPSTGLPPAMFTPVFAVARTVGWVTHWNEMIADPETRIFRPRQLYTGPAERPLVPLAERRAQEPLVG
jgi:citrate synthase